MGELQDGFENNVFIAHARVKWAVRIWIVTPKESNLSAKLWKLPRTKEFVPGKPKKQTTPRGSNALRTSTSRIAAITRYSLSARCCLVVGLYLPQILKLRVAGIELEKSSVDQATAGGALGLSK